MRVTTALNRLLALRGVSVIGVRLTGEGVMVRVRLRRRRIACSGCGQVYTGMHDRDVRRWRHLDLGGHRCFLEYELRRVDCRDCGVRVEAVPWARRGARHTREFEDLVAFCAQQMAKSQVQSLLRVAWDTVGRIIERVVADRLDDRRLAGLVQIGVDEISYRRGRRSLTNVADHQTGGIVWRRSSLHPVVDERPDGHVIPQQLVAVLQIRSSSGIRSTRCVGSGLTCCACDGSAPGDRMWSTVARWATWSCPRMRPIVARSRPSGR